MYAVPVDVLNAILFCHKAPPKGYEQYHGKPQSGVHLEGFDMEIYSWPEGTDRPDVILARSRSDEKNYKVFKYRSDFEMEKATYEDSGRNFFIPGSSRRFIDLIKAVVRSKHRGEWIAWSQDGNRLVASARTIPQLDEEVNRLGEGPAIFEWVELPVSKAVGVGH